MLQPFHILSLKPLRRLLPARPPHRRHLNRRRRRRLEATSHWQLDFLIRGSLSSLTGTRQGCGPVSLPPQVSQAQPGQVIFQSDLWRPRPTRRSPAKHGALPQQTTEPENPDADPTRRRTYPTEKLFVRRDPAKLR